MDFNEYVRIIRRRWQIVVAVFLLCIAAAALITWQATPQYTSSARLFVATSDSDTQAAAYQGGLFASQRVTSYADIVPNSRRLAEQVADSLGDGTNPGTLPSHVTAAVVPETVNLQITATDSSPVRARDIAQAYAEGLSDLVSTLETPAGQAAPLIKAEIIDNASVPSNPVAPQPPRNLALGAVLGLFLGLAAALLREVSDKTIRTSDDIGQATPAPILGSVTWDSTAVNESLRATLSGTSQWAEAFRVMRTNMQFIEVDSDHKVFAITSSLPGEGKSTVAAGLALTLSLTNQRVALVECDLRRPLIAKRLGLDGAIGTTSVLIGKVSLEEAMQSLPDTDLKVLACGPIPPNPSELLQSKAMEAMLAQLRAEFDIVLLDAPPLLPVTDAALLAVQADGALMVVRHGKTSRDQLTHAVERLDSVDAKTLGVVFNMVPVGRGGGSYSYSYTYSYDSPKEKQKKEKKPKREPHQKSRAALPAAGSHAAPADRADAPTESSDVPSSSR